MQKAYSRIKIAKMLVVGGQSRLRPIARIDMSIIPIEPPRVNAIISISTKWSEQIIFHLVLTNRKYKCLTYVPKRNVQVPLPLHNSDTD